jgi:DNA-binding TFAR19-related protein (PDSD5 family)
MNPNMAQNVEQMQEQQRKKAEYEEQRSMILDQILEPGAKDR